MNIKVFNYPTARGFVWRYLTVDKFLDLIVNKELPLTRLDSMSDSLEATSLYEIDNRLFNLPDDVYAKDDGSGSRKLSAAQRRQTYFASFWFNKPMESMGMWDLYSEHSGVAIKWRSNSFRKFVDEELDIAVPEVVYGKLYADVVLYRDLFDLSIINTLRHDKKLIGFHKHKAWEHEHEYRILLKLNLESLRETDGGKLTNVPPIVKLRIAPTYFQKMEVILHPRVNNWHKENIEKLVNYYAPNLTVKRSYLDMRKFDQ